MIGSPAAAALLLLLTIHTVEGDSLSLSSSKKQLLPANSRIGRKLRGQPENADVGVSGNILLGTGAVGHLALFEKCYMTDDCAPGLFVVSLWHVQGISVRLSTRRYPAWRFQPRHVRCLCFSAACQDDLLCHDTIRAKTTGSPCVDYCRLENLVLNRLRHNRTRPRDASCTPPYVALLFSNNNISQETGFRTHCETTPFFGDGPVCCKPFATPCDSDEVR